MKKKKELIKLLQLAYSAERAASFAYQGHASSVKAEDEKKRLKEIEDDEWDHRKYVLDIMNALNIQPSKYFEIKYFIIGKCISLSCHILGWFIPMYFAGRLESGNVNEYIRMINLLKDNKIEGYDEVVMEMAVVEKEHEKYFAGKVKKHPFLPFFAAIFRWSHKRSFNDMNECACRNHFNSCI